MRRGRERYGRLRGGREEEDTGCVLEMQPGSELFHVSTVLSAMATDTGTSLIISKYFRYYEWW